MPEEDFAEMGALLVNFPYLRDKPPLGSLSSRFVTKLEQAAEHLGTPRETVDTIINYYGQP